MRVVTDGPQRLVIEDRPWFNAGFVWLTGAIALGAALAGSVESVSERVLVGVLGCGALAAAWSCFRFSDRAPADAADLTGRANTCTTNP